MGYLEMRCSKSYYLCDLELVEQFEYRYILHPAQRRSGMSEAKLKILGWMGTALSVTMYVSYIPQIINNLQGNKSVFLQPMAAAINCTIWVLYALLKDKKDYPLAAANMPGIICGLIAAITAL